MNHLYVIQIDHPTEGPTLIGPWYRDKEACKSWVKFVKARYHCPTRTRRFTREQAQAIQDQGGQLTEG